jgi:hypothetical protein
MRRVFSSLVWRKSVISNARRRLSGYTGSNHTHSGSEEIVLPDIVEFDELFKQGRIEKASQCLSRAQEILLYATNQTVSLPNSKDHQSRASILAKMKTMGLLHDGLYGQIVRRRAKWAHFHGDTQQELVERDDLLNWSLAQFEFMEEERVDEEMLQKKLLNVVENLGSKVTGKLEQ